MPSETRRTAFARIPRNPAAFAAAKAEKLLRVNKRFLDSLTSVRLEPEITTILTKCDADLQMRIGPNGKGNYTVTSRTGEILGDSSDVQKVQALGSFINAERKAALKLSVSVRTQKILAAMVELSIAENNEISRFPQHFIDALRAIVAQMQTLETNITAITAQEAVGEFNETVKRHLIESATKIRGVVGSYLMYRARLGDDETPDKLNPRLLEAGVMIWTFTRLTAQKLQIGGKDFEFRHIYFPKDPVKGLQITFKEWNTPKVRENQTGILDGCRNVCNLWTWENTRVIAEIPETEPDFEETHRILANVPLLVVPPSGGFKTSELINALVKHGDNGFAWVSPNTTKTQDVVKFLGTVPKRVFLGNLARPVFKTDLITRIFPSFTPDDENRGVYAKFGIQSKDEEFDTKWFSNISSGIITQDQLELVKTVAKDIINVNVGKIADKISTAIDEGNCPNHGHVGIVNDTYGILLANASALETDRTDKLLSGRADPKLFDRKKKKVDDGSRTARCMMSDSGQMLVKTLNRRGYDILAVRIGGWLRSFLTASLQQAVSEVILARLDAFLDNPIKYGRDDHGVILNPVDDESSEEDDDNDSDEEGLIQDNPDD